jgi:hypothetical protein
MEENKEEQKVEKLSYEQLNNVALQLQQRVIQAEQRLKEINYAAMRLNYLFEVLKQSTHFSEEFIKKCSDEIVELLTVDTEETKE